MAGRLPLFDKEAPYSFDGAVATAAGYANLGEIAASIHSRYSEYITTHIVILSGEPPKTLEWTGSILLDPEGSLDDRYGAGSECLYLIRPDGYVGYRAQPADGAKLRAHLDHIFT